MNSTNPKFPRGIEVVTGAVIEDNQGRILLTRSSKWNNKWVFPGGHVEPGETINECTVREIIEEVGLKVAPVCVLEWGEEISTENFHRPAHFIYFHVLCRTDDNTVMPDGLEIQECKWVTPDEAMTMDLAVNYAETIQKLIDRENTSTF